MILVPRPLNQPSKTKKCIVKHNEVAQGLWFTLVCLAYDVDRRTTPRVTHVNQRGMVENMSLHCSLLTNICDLIGRASQSRFLLTIGLSLHNREVQASPEGVAVFALGPKRWDQK